MRRILMITILNIVYTKLSGIIYNKLQLNKSGDFWIINNIAGLEIREDEIQENALINMKISYVC